MVNQSVEQIETKLPDMDVQVNTLPDLNDLIEFKDGVINIINEILKSITTEYTLYLLFGISLLTAWFLKKRWDEGYLFMVFATLTIYFALRYIGLG